MENKTKRLKKFLWTCPVCHGNEYLEENKSTHKCQISLLERRMFISTNGKLRPIPEEKLKQSIKALEAIKNDEENNPVAKPLDPGIEIKFSKTCDGIAKQLNFVKTEKELEAIFERFNKSNDEYMEAYPDRIAEDHPEFIQSTVDKLMALQKKIKK